LRQMILAAVPADRVGMLRAAGDEFVVVPAENWGAAFDAIRLRPVDMAVIDPRLGGEPRAYEVERIRLLFPSLPLMLYTTLEPATAGTLLDLGRSGVRRALFHRFDDSPPALRAAIIAELERSASQRVMASMAGVLSGLPDQLRAGLEALLDVDVGVRTVSELAIQSNVERRTVERLFLRSGLPSPRVVLMALRLLYAHRLLLDPGHTVEDVAVKLGYGKTRTFQAHCREVFGLTAGEVRMTLSEEEAVARVTGDYLTRQRRAVS
jgi:AraC-like DNA-binding protein